jgi:hypothetical protein
MSHAAYRADQGLKRGEGPLGRIGRMVATVENAATRSRPAALALIACGLFLVITVPLAYILNVWQDDAYTLHSTAGTVSYAFHEAIGFEQNAPLYFVAVDLWRHVDYSAFFARIFSVLCAAAVVLLTPSTDPRLVTFTVALNPFLIWTALEIRVYALIVLISALLLLTCYDAFVQDEPRPREMWFFALWVAIGLYTQYYIAFLVVALGAYVFLARRRSIGRFLVACAAGIAAFVPMLVLLPGQVQNFKGEFEVPGLIQSTKWLAGILIAHYVLPLQFMAHRKMAYGGLALLIVISAIAARRWFGRSADFAAIVIIVAGFLTFLFGTHFAGVRILTRHPVSLLLPGIFTPYAVISFLKAPLRSKAALTWFCFAILVSVVSLFATYRSGAKIGDWARVAAYIEQNESPGEPIAVFQAENALPFEYYYHGPNRVIAVPRGVDFKSYNVADFAVHSQAQIAREIPRTARNVWFIKAGWCASANISFGCDIVAQYFARNYRVVSHRAFYQSDVWLLARR